VYSRVEHRLVSDMTSLRDLSSHYLESRCLRRTYLAYHFSDSRGLCRDSKFEVIGIHGQNKGWSSRCTAYIRIPYGSVSTRGGFVGSLGL
jgi:hypothetical protein